MRLVESLINLTALCNSMKKKTEITNKELKEILPKIVKTLKKYNVKKASIFGSYIRGEQTKNSDVDIIIQPKKGLGLFNFVGIKLELEDELGRKVDLLTYKSINPYIKKNIEKEEIRII